MSEGVDGHCHRTTFDRHIAPTSSATGTNDVGFQDGRANSVVETGDIELYVGNSSEATLSEAIIVV